MKTFILTAITGALLSAAWIGTASANSSLSAKVMQDHPGIGAGVTATPTARPDNNNGGLQRKAMQDHPGTVGGVTVRPLAKSDAGSLQAKIRN